METPHNLRAGLLASCRYQENFINSETTGSILLTNIVHRQTAEEEYVVPNSVSTESLAAAALDVERIGWAVAVANKAAAAATTGVVAPNADQVSIDVAPLLGAPARSDQVLSAQAMLFLRPIASAVRGGAGAHLSAESANVERAVLGLVNARTQALPGRRNTTRPAASTHNNSAISHPNEWTSLFALQRSSSRRMWLGPARNRGTSCPAPVRSPMRPRGRVGHSATPGP